MRFSIILPVKNGGEYVKECVISILSQTLQDFNLIMLDNCSTDGTLEWLQSLNDNRIVIYTSDHPLSIEESWGRIKFIPKNEFITLIGHDDLLNENYLEVMDSLIQKHPKASLYQAHYDYIDESGKLLRNCKPMDEIQYGYEFLASYICNLIDSTGTGYMMRSKDFDDLGGMNVAYKNLIFADIALWISLSMLSYKATSFEITFKYRINKSVSKNTNGEHYQEAFEKFLNFIIDQNKTNDKIRAVTQRYGNKMLLYYCESLSHRILKTPPNKRKIIVKDFIAKCKLYAEVLIPNQKFEPEKKIGIKIAKILDSSSLSRNLFLLFKKLK